MTQQSPSDTGRVMIRLLAMPVVTATAWVLLEWLFFVTKPSFMSLFSAAEKAGVLFITALVVSIVLLVVSLPFALLGGLMYRARFPRALVVLIGVFPVILFGTLGLLVVLDNFTLTLFGLGIRDTQGAAIWVYKALTVIIAFWIFSISKGFLYGRYGYAVPRSMVYAALLAVSLGIPWLLFIMPVPESIEFESPDNSAGRPNIIIFSGDGIAADHMSVYGYERATTPFLEQARDQFLLSENHFTNASDTGGSVISLLTGKLPTTTRVIYPPDALRGSDSYQHLPGILKRLGYYNADISMRHYADPYDLNLRNGFDEANFRKLDESGGHLIAALRKSPRLNPTSLLVDRMAERARERYKHIWKDQPMMDPLAVVNRPDRSWIRDTNRMAEIERLVLNATRPFFINVHLMGTHGEVFKPRERVWSTDEDYEKSWHVGGYDDAILDFDRMFEELYTLLERQGLLDTTVLIVSSDHGFMHAATQRLPLMIRLPDRGRAGRIEANTQRIDIAPTLLDYLGIEQPPWMEGRSLFGLDSESATRDIFGSGSTGSRIADGNFWSISSPEPPWFTLGRLYYIRCDQAFTLKLDDMAISEERVAGSSIPCDDVLSPDAAEAVMKAHLRSKGYSWKE